MNVLIIVPHLDDESLSCGALIQNRLMAGDHVHIVVVHTRYYPEGVEVGDQKKHFVRAIDTLHGRLPGTLSYATHDMVEGEPFAIGYYQVLELLEPIILKGWDEIVIPGKDDLNQDHRHLYEICRIALRPCNRSRVKRVLVSSAYDGSVPTFTHFEIMTEAQLDTKIAAIRCYEDELRTKPHPRSIENLTAHHAIVGAQCSEDYAEGYNVYFQLGVTT